MKEAIQPETIKKIESLLLSGEPSDIELGQLLAESQEYDLSDFYSRVEVLCHSFRWSNTADPNAQLLKLAEVKALALDIGESAVRKNEELPKDIRFAHVHSFEDLAEDWADLLPNLEYLSISGGQAALLPDELGLLTQLEVLQLENVFFKQFPKSFRNLYRLRLLEIKHDLPLCKANSYYFALPEEIKDLESLESLKIESPLLSAVPEQIQLVPQLKELYINCDPEALCKTRASYSAFKKQELPDLLHFVPENLKSMPRLEQLTLLLPSRHFPLAPQLFQNSHLRKLVVSSRLLGQLPLKSNEFSRLEEIRIFKPHLLQHLKLSFALPETEIEPLAHPYQKRYLWKNMLLTLFWWPAGAWYFTTELLIPNILPEQSFLLWRWMLILVLYPLAALIFIFGTFYYGLKSLFAKK
jgi:hypothetical protein